MSKKQATTTATERKPMPESKQKLIEISNSIKLAISLGIVEKKITLNENIVEFYKKRDSLPYTEQFQTYRQWLELGFQVKKGEKAYFVWSSPKTFSKEVAVPEATNAATVEYSAFSTCALFSTSQVEPLPQPTPQP